MLEFSKPTNAVFDKLFQFYFFRILPQIGNLLSKHKDAYTYLPRSVRRFPDQMELAKTLTHCGFEKRLTPEKATPLQPPVDGFLWSRWMVRHRSLANRGR